MHGNVPPLLLTMIGRYTKIGKIKPYTGSDLWGVVICPREKTRKTLCFGSRGK